MSTTSELIKHAESGDAVKMKDTLEAILARKAYDALEGKRQEVAKNLVRSAKTNNEE
jgi:hypothetical protein